MEDQKNDDKVHSNLSSNGKVLSGGVQMNGDQSNHGSNCKLNTGKTVSENLFSEQIVSECKKTIKGEKPLYLTLKQYQGMDMDQKNRIHNKVRQWSLKARDSLPTDHGIFCLVVSHLLKNAHRYFNLEKPTDIQTFLLSDQNVSEVTKSDMIGKFHEANKKIRQAGDLKCKNRISEQQKIVSELRDEFHTYRNMASVSGISVKTVHIWCALPKKRIHKASALSKLRREEYEEFLLQDTISFAHPAKKFAGQRFLRDTVEETRKKFLEQTQYHSHGILSMSSMKAYRLKNILLCGKTPLDQCLCDKCENCEQILKALLFIGVKNLSSNRYAAVNAIVCQEREQQMGSDFAYLKLTCIQGKCNACGVSMLEK